MRTKFSGPAVFVADMAASRALYEGALEQSPLFLVGGTYVAYESGLCLWAAEAAQAQLSGSDTPSQPGSAGFELYFESENLDTAWMLVQSAGATMVHAPRTAPWGQRCFHFKDPDGHLVEVGEPMAMVVSRLLDQGVSEEETAKRTSLPLEMVQAVVQKH